MKILRMVHNKQTKKVLKKRWKGVDHILNQLLYLKVKLVHKTLEKHLRNCGSDGKESAYNKAGDLDSIPGSERSTGEANGYPLQYSCQENPKDTGAWRATVYGVTKSQTQLSD